ncbi:nucleoside 2-deoxyribosyltransferase [Herbaspirillum sp. RTI4]|uniref:nucleoside 2-deoxyribosyltransferase n=1 Tax=Herbaspirillum sp. RTI4 TaxID=3048640 RepID=UPI002AB42FB5|nr:nucleoside 2-deoxyribosyltransferase [Herbaspirillum sp. RTI4]MDY7578112.1 nucleoside 2-deoxyribosyltransferase [Herbaspirillum sp. RTI4]MEA9980701.1 nucleoside 2-deoxyribosyltransferase [Herbaspirillum sp. RTI4]
MRMKKIYLAGPDVFRADYAAHKDRLKQLCQAAGLLPLCPADDEIPDDPDSPDSPFSQRIYEQNIALINAADIVMANVQNFRGSEPDSGTVFEIAYAIGKGKKVWCYNVPVMSLRQQIPCDSAGRDADGYAVEDFGLSRNLMLAHSSVQISGDAQACIAAIQAYYS